MINWKKCLFELLSVINSIVPKRQNLVFMNGKENVRWNIYSLAMYLSEKSFYEKYKIVIYVKNLNKIKERYRKLRGISFIDSPLKGYFFRLRCKFYFSEINGEMFACYQTKKQVSFQLGHGFALKAMYYPPRRVHVLKAFNKILCYSPYVKNIMQKEWNFNEKYVVISQNPRCDLLTDCFPIERSPLPIDCSKKNIIWLPTFRNDPASNRNNSIISFPIIDSESIHELDQTCGFSRVHIYIKPHPLQMHLDFFDFKLKNITIIRDDVFNKSEMEFYEFLGYMDALITDYSSVAFDYMILNRPIGYTIDDYDSYNDMRGFHFKDPISMMPGEKIKNYVNVIHF